MDYAEIDELWVFGYGSLMWRPGFNFVEKAAAKCLGYKRKFCIKSVVYRGTAENPGLVLGLDKGGNTHGMAFKIANDERAQVLEYLRDRELVTSVYSEQIQAIEIEGHGVVQGLVYVAIQDHKQYIGGLSLAEQAEIIAFSNGQAGAGFDYLYSTCQSLRALNIFDPALAELEDRVKKLIEA